MQYRANIHRHTRHIISIPFIYMMIVPTIILDIFLELYHRICFPLYGLALVPRAKYIKLDRWKLPYLKWYDRINCWYCEYANGVFSYAVAIGTETEKYWCGIKHAPDSTYNEPAHHAAFIAYGDSKALDDTTCKMQKKELLKDTKSTSTKSTRTKVLKSKPKRR